MASLAVNGVSQRYGEVTALRDITVALTGPKLVVVLGPNGAGKTTFLDLVEGLSVPTSGTISVFGKAITPDTYPRRDVGVVMQREFILDGVTVRDYADLFAAIYEIPNGQSKILERAGLKARAGIGVERLSGGEAQRLFIAAATVHDPKILFLDEPTSELDPESKRRIGEVLRERARSALVVMTTHDLEEAERLADEVLFLLDGTLRAHGPKSEVVGERKDLREAFFHFCGRTVSHSGEAL